MRLFNFADGRALAFLPFFLSFPAAQELDQLLASTHTVTGYDWEWVLIRINNVGGLLDNADFMGAADAQVTVTALDAVEPPVEFDKPLSTFESIVEQSTNSPEWFEIGMVAYQEGSVSQLEVVLIDQDVFNDDELLKTTVELPTEYDKWMEYTPSQDGYNMNISLWRSTTPIFTETEHTNMNLTEVLFDLEDGSKSSLVHHITPGNNKAVLYFPGRHDSFAHPHVLQMYEEKGYDFYSLDARRCGRTRRFMDDSNYRLAHSIDDFDKYKEETDLTLDFIRSQNGNYTQLLAHTHSTGALMALNYAMLVEEEPFEGYILNGPFLDWGHVSTFEEIGLERAGLLEWFGMDNLASESEGTLASFHARLWILNRFNTTWRPIYTGHTTTEWAQASTDVHKKITGNDGPITDEPVLHIASLGDVVLVTSESEERIPNVAVNYTEVILTYNSHDVTYSVTEKLNKDAIVEISQWLDNPEPNEFSSGGIASLWMGRGTMFATLVGCANLVVVVAAL